MNLLPRDLNTVRLRLPMLALLFFILGHIFAERAWGHNLLNIVGVVLICTAVAWLFYGRLRPARGRF